MFDQTDRRYIIGIDLGTTNSAVSYVDLENKADGKPRINLFKVPQLTGPGEITRQSVLPSFLYIPGTYDISKESIETPWESDTLNFAGIYARNHGSQVPSRLVSSAKSWLCHDNVDRHARILPWGSGDDVFKVSPVQATAFYLSHIKKSWNHYKGDDVESFLENQMIIITVPASFDEVARDLTLEAAKTAGLPNVTLIEEPLAAFYSWLIQHEKKWDRYIKPDELVLVCDVGGGTTDFTLITLREVDGSPRFERIAVGDHLVLGGDNVDIALAEIIKERFGMPGKSITGDRWKTLCHQCRQAKEIILDNIAESKKITLMGQGSSLIAGTMSAELTRKDVEDAVLRQFLPVISRENPGKSESHGNVTEFGLPYESDSAITRHLGWFLERHKEDVGRVLKSDRYTPDLILFNGGSLKPAIIQERIKESIRSWFGETDTAVPGVLENPNPDTAVALGAAYYGLVKSGIGVKVGSGSPRSYYLGISKPGEVVGQKEAICLVERGLDEGSDIIIEDKKFEVLANQPVAFNIYSSSYRSGDMTGDVVSVDDSFTILPPVQTMIQFGKKGTRTTIPVKMEAGYTEMGTLALWARSTVSKHRWQLQFQLRASDSPIQIADDDIFDESIIEKSVSAVHEVFSNKTGNDRLEKIVKEIAEIVERPKNKWPLGLIRSITDELIKNISARKTTAVYESRWLNLTGFCFRPGFGDAFDAMRIKQLWKIYKQGVIFNKNAQTKSEWWIFWRRISGGLTPGQQRLFMQDLTPVIMAKKSAKVKLTQQERFEIWMAIANLELLLVKDKIKWGRHLLGELNSKRCSQQLFWALSRIGARELLYGPVDRVIPAGEIINWIDKLLSEEWRNPKPVAVALSQLARKTGDPSRDIEDSIAVRVVEWLNRHENFKPYARFVQEVVKVERQEENTMFGESLPDGLILHD